MNLKIKLNLIKIVCISMSAIPFMGHASEGSDVAKLMEYYYKHTARDCGQGREASNCSGLFMRGTDSGKPFGVWDASPASHVSGGVSVSYFRKDAEYQDLGLRKNNGFVLAPNDFRPVGRIKIKPLCIFPVDAWTDYRAEAGCGDYKPSHEIENSCQEINIKSAADWLKNYRAIGSDHKKQCGFNIKDYGSFNKADAFNAAIQARSFIKDEEIHTQTEVRLEVWPNNSPLGILAWIYTGIKDRPDTNGQTQIGRTLAQDDQRKWFEHTKDRTGRGEFIPVIEVKMPGKTSDDATFIYRPSDQLVSPSNADKGSCDSYVLSAMWDNNYYEPIAKKTISSLRVAPTACARTVGKNKTNVIYAELALKYANHPKWNFDRLGSSMRRQLTCHLAEDVIAISKPSFNIEPERPYVSQEVALKENCNPPLQ